MQTPVTHPLEEFFSGLVERALAPRFEQLRQEIADLRAGRLADYWLTPEEAGRILRRHPRTVISYCRGVALASGAVASLAHRRLPDGSYLIRAGAIDEFLSLINEP